MRVTFALLVWLSCVVGALGQEKASPTELAKKPMYERLLKGEDAKKVEELEKKITAAEAADNWEEAIQLWEEVLALRTRLQGADHWEVTDAKLTLKRYQRLLTLTPEQRRKVIATNDLNQKVLELWQKGRSREALPIAQEALKTRMELLGPEDPLTALSYLNLGAQYKGIADYANAAENYRKALDISRKVLGEDHPDTAGSYNNLAMNLQDQGQYAQAQPLYQKALDICRRVLGEDHPDTATSYNNLALNLHARGKATEAAALLRQTIFSFEASRLSRAKGIDRAIGERFNPRLLLAVIEQAQSPAEAWSQVEFTLARGLLDQQGQADARLTPAEVAELDQLRKRLNELQPNITALVSQAKRTAEQNSQLEELLKDRREVSQRLTTLAVTASTRAVASREQIQAAIPPGAALLLWVDVSSRGIEEHFACVVRREGEPFWVRLPGSGDQGKWTKDDAALPAKVREGLAHRVPSSNLVELMEQLRRQRIEPVLAHLKQHRITQLLVVGVNAMAGIPVEVIAPEFTISYVPSGTFLARLPKKPAYDNTLFAVGDPIYEVKRTKPIEWTALPPHGLLINALAPGGEAAQRGLKPGQVLLQYGETKLTRVEDLRAAIQKATAAGAKTMPVTVWDVDEQDKGREEVVAFPVGPLGVILAREPAPEAVGNRRKQEQFFAKLRRGEEWHDLPGTRYEVQRLRELFTSATVLLDEEASERAVDQLRQSGELARFRYLHFATHGKGNDVIAFESKLVLSQNQPRDEFSKPGEPWYNNEISAREVLNFWKLNADLVTLSACQTGLGVRGGGEGLLGFAQAFLLSGARSVCLSLWEVDDLATALLMQRFYQNLLGRRAGLNAPLGKAKALEEAKDWLRNLTAGEATALTAQMTRGVARGSRGEKRFKLPEEALAAANSPRDDYKPYARPHYWSAFILIGDPE